MNQENFLKNIPDDYYEFTKDNAFWLEDFALFSALKNSFCGASFVEWQEDYLKRNPVTLEKAKKELFDEIEYFKFVQYIFSKQWHKLKEYAENKDIESDNEEQ